MTRVSDKSLTIRATIEVEGTPSEVAAWLARLPREDTSEAGAAAEWTPEDVHALVERISPRAREALWHMAQAAPVISFKDLQKKMKLDGVGLGGVMASFGFAERAGFSRPYEVDRKKRQYRVDPQLAEMLIDAISNQG